MMPIGPLMIEHRLIERMVDLLKKEFHTISETQVIDTSFIEEAIDFFKVYADRCHHGKEEDILFRDLSKKDLSPEHKVMMDELIQEHVFGRETTRKLLEATERFRQGDSAALDNIRGLLKKLVEFYPAHIEKEDKHFFLPSMEYFSKEEQDAMLQECWEFDRKLIHEKYRQVVERFENEK
jgi:hemerythrin-like domain-containing protein